MRIVLCALNAKYVHTSLALRYLEIVARKTTHQVESLELTVNDPLASIEAAIDRMEPDLLAISCYIWNIAQVFELADTLKKIRPGLKILLGGPEVSYDAPALLAENPAVDMIIAGEGETSWAALLEAMPGGSLARVPGLCWRDGKDVKQNPAPPPLPLASLPAPYTAGTDGLGGRLVYYESSRGCPFACAFCLSGNSGGVRRLDPRRVLDEMEILAGSGAAAVKFVDRTFNCRPDHALAIWRGLLRYQGRMCFHFEIVADLLGEEELGFLETVPPGLFQFEIGVQTTNPETLAAIGRRMDRDRLEANVRRLLAAGNIHLHLDFIAGLPHEGCERFLESLDFGLSLGPDLIQLGFLKMLRGTRLRAEAESLGYAYRRRPPYEVLENPWLSFAELNRLKTVAHLVEAYYNERRFAASRPRLYASWPSPARFFSAFAAYSEERGWHLRAHQPRDLPRHLLDFAAAYGLADPVLKDCLRYDLHCLARSDAEPAWAEVPGTPGLQTRWHEWLRRPENRALLGPEFVALRPREAVRRARILAFNHDPTAPATAGVPGPAILALVYPERGWGQARVRAVKIALPD